MNEEWYRAKLFEVLHNDWEKLRAREHEHVLYDRVCDLEKKRDLLRANRLGVAGHGDS